MTALPASTDPKVEASFALIWFGPLPTPALLGMLRPSGATLHRRVIGLLGPLAKLHCVVRLKATPPSAWLASHCLIAASCTAIASACGVPGAKHIANGRRSDSRKVRALEDGAACRTGCSSSSRRSDGVSGEAAAKSAVVAIETKARRANWISGMVGLRNRVVGLLWETAGGCSDSAKPPHRSGDAEPTESSGAIQASWRSIRP